VQDVVLALLSKGPSHGYELRQRLQAAMGPLAAAVNAGQVYVTLGRLERSGLVVSEHVGQPVRPDRRVYELTAAGHDRVAVWLTEVDWPKPAPAEFHLKLTAVAAAGLADPVAVADAQRRELLRRMSDARAAVLAEPDGSAAGLLLEAVLLRLQADIDWLEACARHWGQARRGDER
jgi:DNA-binding PadR family transcriptional regulator